MASSSSQPVASSSSQPVASSSPQPLDYSSLHITSLTQPTGSSSSQPIESASSPQMDPSSSEHDLLRYLPLYKAILRGDLKWVKFYEYRYALGAEITVNSDTALHVAVGTGMGNHIVEYLLTKMSDDQVVLTNKDGDTALSIAAIVGNCDAAKKIMGKQRDSINMKNNNGYIPLIEAARHGHRKMIEYLSQFRDSLLQSGGRQLLSHEQSTDNPVLFFVYLLIIAGFYDLALKEVEQNVSLAITELYPGETLLSAIARKPSAFPSERKINFVKKAVYMYKRIFEIVHHIGSCIVKTMLCIQGSVKKEMQCIRSFIEKTMPCIRSCNERTMPCNQRCIKKMTSCIKTMTSCSLSCTGIMIRCILPCIGSLASGGKMILEVGYMILGVDDIMRNWLIILVYKSLIGDKKWTHQQKIILAKALCQCITDSLDFYGSTIEYRRNPSILKQPLLLAAELGVHEVVEEIINSYPDAVLFLDEKKHNAFHLAIINRHEGVFNIISEMSCHKHLLLMFANNFGNNILHLAGKLAPLDQLSRIPGAALQMQRELQWFKEVGKIVPPKFKEEKNLEGKTPAMVFAQEHQSLVKEGEKWMKDAATSCSVATALIATVVFAAAITVPGGNNNGGQPNFYKERAFTIFCIADAISLFSSVAAIFMFLSILTARYAEADFLYALPKRFILGLLMLFLSVTAMMLAFGSTVYLVFCEEKENWVLGLVIGSAVLPVSVFAFSQFPLLVDLTISTYGPSIFG